MFVLFHHVNTYKGRAKKNVSVGQLISLFILFCVGKSIALYKRRKMNSQTILEGVVCTSPCHTNNLKLSIVKEVSSPECKAVFFFDFFFD